MSGQRRPPVSCPYKIQAIAAETNKTEKGSQAAKKPLQGLRLHYQGGEIFAAGCQPMLEDVNSEVFVCRSSDEALVLGVESDSAKSMYDIAFGKVCVPCRIFHY